MKRIVLISDGWKRLVTYAWVYGIMKGIEKSDEKVSLYQYNTYGNWTVDKKNNIGEYNLYELPDFSKFDGVVVDLNNISSKEVKYRLVEKLRSLDIPVVSLTQAIDGLYYVGIDNAKPIRQLMDHLYEEHGCRSFMYCGGPEDNYENIERLSEFLRQIQNRNLSVEDTPIFYGDYDFNTGVRYMDEIMKKNIPFPDAIICANDNIACGLCTQSAKYGIRIPDDFRVTGFDNLDKASFFKPQITTVSQDRERIGELTFELLRDIWDNKEVERFRYLDAECVYGESCGCKNSGLVDYRDYAKGQVVWGITKEGYDERVVNLKNRMSECEEFSEIFQSIAEYFNTLECDGFYVVVDEELLELKEMDQFPVSGYNKELLRVAYAKEKEHVLEIHTEKELEEYLRKTDTGCAFMYTAIHFEDHTIGYTILKNGRFLYENPYFFDIHSAFTDRLEDLYQKKRLRMMNQKLEEARLEAQQANTAKSNFLANMSHEIRTPMNAIIGFSELVLQEKLPGVVTDYVTDIKTSSHALLAIINDILDLSKLESGKMELCEEDYYLGSVLRDVYLLNKNQADKKHLEFEVKIFGEIPDGLHGDKTRVRQVLVNLLGNSVKYTQKGKISLHIRLLEKYSGGCVIAFQIADTGIGIRKEELSHIFDAFTRVDMKKNQSIEGTGLGLAVTLAFLKLMGGDLQVESEYGKGSVFTAIIPQRIHDTTPVNLQMHRKDKEIEQYTMKNITIKDTRVLVVDDNPINLKVMEKSLKHYGLKVDFASGGLEAIRLCTTNCYPIVFMDQMMPHMDGTETMKEIRKINPYYAHGGEGRIIVLTANAIAGVRENLLKEGFDEYLGKPVNYNRMEQLFISILPRDKVSFQEKESEEIKDCSSRQEILERILSQINIQEGIQNLGGDEEAYISILSTFPQVGRQMLLDAKYYWEKANIEDFVIRVHGMKGACLNIGANACGEMAKSLEMAGKSNDLVYIKENIERFSKRFSQMLNEIEHALEEIGVKQSKPIEKNQDGEVTDISKELEELKNVIMQYDFAKAAEQIRHLERLPLTKELREVVEKIKTLADDMDIEGILGTFFLS